MLMNDFYTISDAATEANKWVGRIAFNPDHDIFKGHFPGQPVVPGVCMMQIVKEILETVLGRKMQIQQAAQVKFLQLISPDIFPSVQVDWTNTEGGVAVNAVFKTEKDLFKMNARLANRETD